MRSLVTVMIFFLLKRRIDCQQVSNITLHGSVGVIGTLQNPATSCKEIRDSLAYAENGLYNIIDTEGNVFTTYCDMTTDGGGWTLVASVHENNINGKCTSGDRWSSEQGSTSSHRDGDGFWENRAVHGSAASATSDDYKNFGYFGLKALNVMVWHVPNDTPLSDYEIGAYLKYYTNNAFLLSYGRNLQRLFVDHYPMKSHKYTALTDNGPSVPIIWARGSDALIMEMMSDVFHDQIEPGFLQFRALNQEQTAFALCPGVRITTSKNVEHMCIATTSYHVEGHNYCGDFAAWNWFPDVPSIAWESTIMIFYR